LRISFFFSLPLSWLTKGVIMSLPRSQFASSVRQRFFRASPPVRASHATLWRKRTGLRSPRRRSIRGHRLAACEQLEKKQLLAIDLAMVAPNPGGWVTVVANNGSNVFAQMAATEPRSLLIADNASFQPRLEVPAFNENFESLYVYHGTVVNRSAFNPIYDPNDPLRTFGVPQGYPWLAGNPQQRDLFFVMQTEVIDWTEPVVGSLDLNDGTPNDTIFFTNLDLSGNPTTTLRITNGPGVGTELVYATGSSGGTRAPQLTFTFDNDTLFGASVGQTGVPVLSLDYDADGRPGAIFVRRVVSRSLGAAVGRPHTFQIFDPLQHQYVPGTFEGTIDLVFGPSTVSSIDFRINSPASGPAVPIGFGPARAARGNLGQFVWTNREGVDQTQTIVATGTLNTLTGVLTVNASILNGVNFSDDGLELRPFSTYVSQARVALRDIDPTDNAADPTGLIFDAAANNFTLWPGQTFTRNLFVELANPESVVTIESPLVTRAPLGRVSLAGTQVLVNAPVRADDRFDVPDAARSRFGTVTEMVTLNSIVGSPTFDIRLGNSPLTPSIRRGRLTVTQTGSMSDLGNVLTRAPETLPLAEEVFVEVVDGDIYLEGRVVAEEQSYLVSSPRLVEDGTSQIGPFPGFVPYNFTTRSRLTGQDVGVIEATTLAITLGNDTIVLPPVPPLSPFVPSTAFAILDISTSTSAIRVQASDRVNDPLQQPFPYKLTVRERDDLVIDAVAASSLPISIFANGSIDLLGLLESAGDVRLQSTEQFVLGAPITTRFGRIELEAPNLVVRNSIRVLDSYQDERQTDILLVASDGSLVMQDAVSGINRVELRQAGLGAVSGANRVFADIVEVTAAGDVDIRTAANRVIVRSPGSVSIDELDYGIFEVRDAGNVTLIANGFDQILKGSEAGLAGDRAYVSPALFADLYDTQVLTVSAPNGSVDVLHYGANRLTLGDISLIDSNRARPMLAAGSVSIRSTLGAIDVFDAPIATGNARQVRLGTTAALGGTYRHNSPGVVPSRLDNIRITRVNELGAQMPGAAVEPEYRFALELDRVDVTTLRLNDRILVKNGGGGVGNQANGIYTIVGINYPVGDTSHMFLNLVRSNDADTTAELAQKHYVRISDGQTLRNQVWTADGSERTIGGQPVYLGWGLNNEYRFANVFDNEVGNVPVHVTPIESRTGFVAAKAVATVPLLIGAEAATYDFNQNTITGTGGDFRVPRFNGVEVFEGDLVLVRYGAGDGAGLVDRRSPGLYVVAFEGDGVSEQWRLERYEGIDDDGDGVLNAFFTGRVAIDEGSLRTAVTGQMFEISLGSLGFSNLRYQPVTEYSGAGQYDSVLHYRTDIGTDNPTAIVRFIVSTQNGRNNETGSFGKMLTLLQANSAINSRTGDPQAQSLSFNATVSQIRLRQELPPIQKPVTIVANRPIAIDGTDIQTSWQGAVVRSGSVSSSVGPLRPTETSVGRRLYRPGVPRNDGRVHGLQLLDGSDGSIVGGLTFGGFGNGAAILVANAGNVLIQDMTLGRSASGGVLANQIGIEVQGPGVEHTTIRRSTILNSRESGILLGEFTGDVRVVGNSIGVQGQGNGVGITLSSVEGTAPAYIGAASGLLSAVTSVRGVVQSIDLVADKAVVRFVVNANSERLAPGVILLESTGNVDRQIEAIAPVSLDGQEFYDVTVADASRVNPFFPNRGELVKDGQYEFQVGAMAESGAGSPVWQVTEAGSITRGDTEIVLPAFMNPGDVFLGQEVSTPRGGFASGTTIKAIRTANDGKTILTLSRPIQETTRGLLILGRANPNLVLGNSDGIVIDSYSSRIVNTVVANSIFDGIRVERTDGRDPLPENQLRGVHTLGDSQGVKRGPSGETFVTSSQNLVVYGNQLSGIRFTKMAFAALGSVTGTNTVPGTVPAVNDAHRAADYERIDQYLANNLRLRGNIIGLNPATNQSTGNGLTGVSNVVVDLLDGDPGYEARQRINFLLLGDTTPLHDNGTPEVSGDDPVSARLRPNVGTGLDSQRNQYGIGTTIGQPGTGDGTRQPTSPRRPIVRG
jgi:hypothetical protein